MDIKRVREKLQDLFNKGLEPFPYSQLSLFMECPPSLSPLNGVYRKSLEIAGSQLRLAEVTYNGVSRLCEFYSFRNRQRADGCQVDYVFCYDRTGGVTGPGIKAFIPQNIQNVVILDSTYVPRWQVEFSEDENLLDGLQRLVRQATQG